MILSICLKSVLLVLLGAAASRSSKELYWAGSLLGDRLKLQAAWEKLQSPEAAAALTEAWIFEGGAALDEELVGTPPFLKVLSLWEEKEPDNLLPALLRELFSASRQKRLPHWEVLRDAAASKRRIAFHYREARNGTLELLLKKRGNDIETWILWLGRAPLTNVERVSGLIQTGLLEARFHFLTGAVERGRQVLETVESLVGKLPPEPDEIALRTLALRAALIQEQILLDLIAGKARRVPRLCESYREVRKKQAQVLGRLSVLSNLHDAFVNAYRVAYREIRAPRWADVVAVDAPTMALFAELFLQENGKAVDRLWRYRPAELEDFTKDLEKNLDIFTSDTIKRAQAARFMDFLRTAVAKPEGVPLWAVPAFERVLKAYRNAPALGRRELTEEERRAYAWVTGALSFYAGIDKDADKWIKAFKEGKVPTYLLLAFTRHKINSAVPAVIERLKALARAQDGREAVLEHVLCLERLTGKSLGLDPQAWEKRLQEETSK